MPDKKLKLVEKDPWLEGNQFDILERHNRYLKKLDEIVNDFGSLLRFSSGHSYFGLNHDEESNEFTYREWAPQADALFLTGNFNNWDKYDHPLEKNEYGIWEIFLPESEYKNLLLHKSLVKVIVQSKLGEQYRIPAYIKRVVQNPDTKEFTGQVWWAESFEWSNDNPKVPAPGELFIYEAHVGMAQEKERVGKYKEFTKNILPRVKASGYNAIQLMAIQEHPYYGSFGYHVSNFFAPSSRFGTPEDLKELIREAHRIGIVVILDIVHSHTVKNTQEGINQFDGSDAQYFHSGSRGDHPEWDSKLFDYGKTEVLRFLLSNLKYWLEEFHFDGFRFDGVGSMMYFHHGNQPIDSMDKYFNQGVEWDAVTYLQLANKLIHTLRPDAVSIAEDVTGMPGLTSPIDEGGLGFDYRLGMGIPDFWIEMLKEKKDEEWNMHKLWEVLNNRLPYVNTVAYAESHDQALVGDKTLAFWLMDKEMYYHMQKNEKNLVIDRGIALHKMIRLYTMALGGQAYMNFMGNEFGHPEWIDFPRQGNNWSYKYCRRQWSLAADPTLKYEFLGNFDKAMIEVMKQNKVMAAPHAQQLNIDENNKTIIFERGDLIFIFNFHPNNSIPDYEFRAHLPGDYEIVLNTDREIFGGYERVDENLVYGTKGQYNHIKIYATNRTALVLKRHEQ